MEVLYWMHIIGLIWIIAHIVMLLIRGMFKIISAGENWLSKTHRPNAFIYRTDFNIENGPFKLFWEKSKGDVEITLEQVMERCKEELEKTKALPEFRIFCETKADTASDRAVDEMKFVTLLLHTVVNAAIKLKEKAKVVMEYKGSGNTPMGRGASLFYKQMVSIIKQENSRKTIDISLRCKFDK